MKRKASLFWNEEAKDRLAEILVIIIIIFAVPIIWFLNSLCKKLGKGNSLGEYLK